MRPVSVGLKGLAVPRANHRYDQGGIAFAVTTYSNDDEVLLSLHTLVVTLKRCGPFDRQPPDDPSPNKSRSLLV
jgi:hypothetical protein